MIVAGVDNGFTGAISFYNVKKNEMVVFDMFVNEIVINGKKRKEYNAEKIKDLFVEFNFFNDLKLVVLEKAQPFHAEGAISSFSTGKQYGLMIGLLTGLGIKYEIVQVKSWQKAFGIKGKLGDTKVQAEKIVNNKFSHIITRTKRGRLLDGRCDAVLMAEYASMLV